MKDLKVWNEFFSDKDNVNIIELENEGFWFQFSHLAKILGYTNPTVALQTHCENYEIKKLDIGQYENVNFVSESGFYSLVLGSKKPQAKKFKKWVCSEILPKLRADGFYIARKDDETISKLKSEITKLEYDKNNLVAWQQKSVLSENLTIKSFGNQVQKFGYYFGLCSRRYISWNFTKDYCLDEKGKPDVVKFPINVKIDEDKFPRLLKLTFLSFAIYHDDYAAKALKFYKEFNLQSYVIKIPKDIKDYNEKVNDIIFI